MTSPDPAAASTSGPDGSSAIVDVLKDIARRLGTRDDELEIDDRAEARVKNLHEALNGQVFEASPPELFWDGSTNQDNDAYVSIEPQLVKPPRAPRSDVPAKYHVSAKTGS